MNATKTLFAKILLTVIPIALLSGCESTNSAPQLVPYEVTEVDEVDGQTQLRIALNDRTEKDSVIAIALKEKTEREVDGEFVCFFSMKGHKGAFAWAKVSYLPECSDCKTDTDAAGNPVEFNLIGLSKAAADSLKGLTFDSIPNKKYLGEHIADSWKSKDVFYEVEDEILVAHLFHTGYNIDTYVLKDAASQLYQNKLEKDVFLTYDRQKGTATFTDDLGGVFESITFKKL